MTQKHGKSVFLSTLIFLFLAGILIADTDKEKKEKKKEPFQYFDTTGFNSNNHAEKEKAKKKKEPAKNNETSTTTAQVKPEGHLSNVDDADQPTGPTVEVAYINGKPHGKAIERYKDGYRVEGEYNNGKKNGLWIMYDKTGRKCTQESYKDGKKDGKSIRWDEGGYVNETDYKDDLLHGKQSCWDKNGKLISEYGYKNGKLHGRYVAWHANGNKSDEGYFNEGTGELSIWYPSGKISIKSELKNGKPYGKEIWWYENGQKKREQTYNEEGKRIGKFTNWYENGKVAFEMEFDQNEQRLYKRDYDKDGNLIFDNDRPVDKKKTTKINSYIEIPGYFDLRNEGKVTAVKSQLQTHWSNTCWAFAYLGALESRLMPPVVPYPVPDYSEQHLADKNHGWDANGLTVGGTFARALAYLTRGGGPVDETDMPYDPAHALGRQISFPPKKWIREVMLWEFEKT
jgi:antitoxin component YwqK of YwqJK toxin-antitoxin module